MKDSNKMTTSFRHIHEETCFLAGLLARGLTYDDFMELPTVQRAVAFSVRIIQHNIQAVNDNKLRDNFEFDWLPNNTLCPHHRRAPIASELDPLWEYLANQLPLLHEDIQAIVKSLDSQGKQPGKEDGETEPAPPETNPVGRSNVIRMGWTRTLINYQKSVHQFFTTVGQLNRFCRDHNISPILPADPTREDIDRLRAYILATDPAPEAAATLELHYNQSLKDLDARDKLVKKIEAIVAATPDMMRAFQVPGLSPIGAFAAFLVYPDADKFKPAQFVTHMGFTPCAKRINYKKAPDGLQRQLLHTAMDDAAKIVCNTPDEKSELYRWSQQQLAEGKVPHSVVFAIAGSMSELLWRCLMRYSVKDAAGVQDAFTLKLTQFAGRLGEDFVKTLGFTSCDDYVAKTIASLNESSTSPETDTIPEEPKAPEPEVVTYELEEAAPKPKKRAARKTPLRSIVKKSTKLLFRRSKKDDAAE